MNKLLVVGGAGFIGSHLVNLCLRQGCQVWVYDDFSTGREEFLPAHSALRLIKGDILDAKSLSDIMGQCSPDIIYHLAAIHHIPTCEKAPERALRVNVEGTQCVLSACAQHKVSRLVFASTGAVYDTGTGPLSETSPLQAGDIYSISKVSGERLVQHYISKNETQAIIARLFNTVGRRETNPHLIPDIMIQLASGKRQLRLGNLYPRRDYIHVEDVAEALFTLGHMPLDQPLDIFNVGSGQDYSALDLVELCAEVINEPIEALSVPELQRKVDRPSQLADVTKIQQVTTWKPKRTLKQALHEVWEEYLFCSK